MIDLRADADLLPQGVSVMGTPSLTFLVHADISGAPCGTPGVASPIPRDPSPCRPPSSCMSSTNQSQYGLDGEASEDDDDESTSTQSESYIQFLEARSKVLATIGDGLSRGIDGERLVVNVLKAGHLPPPLTADELLAQQNRIMGMIDICKEGGQEGPGFD